MLGGVFFALNRDHNQQVKEERQTTPTLLSHAFEPAALLSQAAIWHPANDNALIYQPYDTGTEAIRYFWMEGVPRQWDAFPISSRDDSAHLVWLNTDGKLWYSQINPDGSRKLLALNLAPNEVQAMVATRSPNGSLVIAWQKTNNTLGVILIDALGRKLAEQTLVPNATHFDLTGDPAGGLYLVWATTPQAGQRRVSALPFTTDTIGTIDVDQASYFDLPIPASDWLDTVRILVDDEWVYLIWGINTATSPEVTTFEFRPLLKADIRPHEFLPNSVQAPLVLSTSGIPVPLRWAGRVQNWDVAGAQFALTAYFDNQWTAVLVNFANGAYTGYENLSDVPANASQPRIMITNGQQVVAWVRINSDGQLIQEIHP
ncbi:MAG: hypothetical protein HY862_15405 [Chloroflexi bacterium]|nr:hypothetical protein [Chloroflexota bacterium]